MAVNKKVRNERYWKLRKAGFSGEDANKYKDRSNLVVEELINEKKLQAEKIRKIEERRHSHVKKR